MHHSNGGTQTNDVGHKSCVEVHSRLTRVVPAGWQIRLGLYTENKKNKNANHKVNVLNSVKMVHCQKHRTKSNHCQFSMLHVMCQSRANKRGSIVDSTLKAGSQYTQTRRCSVQAVVRLSTGTELNPILATALRPCRINGCVYCEPALKYGSSETTLMGKLSFTPDTICLNYS